MYDGKGNVAAVLNASQAVVAAYRYAPFGKLLAKTGSLTQPFGFSTKRYDEQTGLIYYGFRFYEPEISRWLTQDPLGEAGGMNLYAFVGNNPVSWVDPWGLKIKMPGLDNAIQLRIGFNTWVRGHLDFLPNLVLDMLLPVDPQSIADDALIGFLCPIDVSGGSGKGAGKSLKELIEQIAEHARKHNPRMLKDELIELIGEVIQRGKQSGNYKKLPGGREAYFDDLTGRIVIINPKSAHGGTSFIPSTGRGYFKNL